MAQAALGVDGLRLWVALYGAESAKDVRIGPTIVKEVEQRMSHFRIALRFVLGAVANYEGAEPHALGVLDEVGDEPAKKAALVYRDDKNFQYILRQFATLQERVARLNDDLRFRAVANETHKFVRGPFSSVYLVRRRQRANAESKRVV